MSSQLEWAGMPPRPCERRPDGRLLVADNLIERKPALPAAAGILALYALTVGTLLAQKQTMLPYGKRSPLPAAGGQRQRRGDAPQSDPEVSLRFSLQPSHGRL